eukprot:9471533-Pyramimonas_sp.AAC.2
MRELRDSEQVDRGGRWAGRWQERSECTSDAYIGHLNDGGHMENAKLVMEAVNEGRRTYTQCICLSLPLSVSISLSLYVSLSRSPNISTTPTGCINAELGSRGWRLGSERATGHQKASDASNIRIATTDARNLVEIVKITQIRKSWI